MRLSAALCARFAFVVVVAISAWSQTSTAQPAWLASLPPHQQTLMRERRTRWAAMPAVQQHALAQRMQAWDVLPETRKAARREAWFAWQSLPLAQRLRLRTAASAYAALPAQEQRALREEFDALNIDERRGWQLGPVIGADYPHLQPLIGQLPANQRNEILATLQHMSLGERHDLAVLAQRTPPQARDALRRGLLTTSQSNRAAWLQAQLER